MAAVHIQTGFSADDLLSRAEPPPNSWRTSMLRLAAPTVALLLAAALQTAAPAAATTGAGCYRPTNVPAWDVLNVRQRPTARSAIVMALSSETYAIIAGRGRCLKGWCPVSVSDERGTKRGWIKARYLASSECP
jgi:hypothetical protein